MLLEPVRNNIPDILNQEPKVIKDDVKDVQNRSEEINNRLNNMPIKPSGDFVPNSYNVIPEPNKEAFHRLP